MLFYKNYYTYKGSVVVFLWGGLINSLVNIYYFVAFGFGHNSVCLIKLHLLSVI
jgi:hypothetical protein